MNVSKITIGRLFNLGNYEHVRYELTVDVQPGEAPTAMLGIENILAALNPKMPDGTLTDNEVSAAKRNLKMVREMTDEQVRQHHGQSKYSLILKWEKALECGLLKTDRWKNFQSQARAYLDDLGGAAKYVDAKENWQDFNEDF